MTEPWLRGILPDLDPVIAHLVRSCDHIREDMRKVLSRIDPAHIEPSSVGFHARHLAGSTRRLSAYLEGRELTPEELAAIPGEMSGNETAAELMRGIVDALNHYQTLLRALPPEDFATPRYVGRDRLPVTAIGLAIHIAEHGQRHVGQAITAAKRASARS